MSTKTVQTEKDLIVEAAYASSREAEIEALSDAPTGEPMETSHWVFLGVSGIVLPIIVLWWGWA